MNMKKDILASGGKSAKFAGGMGENDIFRNVMSEEDAAAADAATAAMVIEKKELPKKVFRPRGATILVRRSAVEELSPLLAGVDSVAQEVPAEGVVIAVGNETNISVGDRIVFGKYAGTEFKLNGETLLIMDTDDVKGMIEDEASVTTFVNSTFEVGGCIVGRS